MHTYTRFTMTRYTASTKRNDAIVAAAEFSYYSDDNKQIKKRFFAERGTARRDFWKLAPLTITE